MTQCTKFSTFEVMRLITKFSTAVRRDAECDIREARPSSGRQPGMVPAQIKYPSTCIYMICIYK